MEHGHTGTIEIPHPPIYMRMSPSFLPLSPTHGPPHTNIHSIHLASPSLPMPGLTFSRVPFPWRSLRRDSQRKPLSLLLSRWRSFSPTRTFHWHSCPLSGWPGGRRENAGFQSTPVSCVGVCGPGGGGGVCVCVCVWVGGCVAAHKQLHSKDGHCLSIRRNEAANGYQ